VEKSWKFLFLKVWEPFFAICFICFKSLHFCELCHWCDSENASKLSAGSDIEKDHQADAPSPRRRSRNIQLTSLFDSLTQFFSADSDQRRRTAYVNATVSMSLAQTNFSTQQKARQQIAQRTTSHKSMLVRPNKPQLKTGRKLPQLASYLTSKRARLAIYVLMIFNFDTCNALSFRS